jgi:hypothetical protein
MHLPYVIDNRAHTLADVLNDLLHSDAVRALTVCSEPYRRFDGTGVLDTIVES